MTRIYQKTLRAMPIFLWALLVIITIFMLIELTPKQSGWQHWDKVQHVTIFLALTLIGAFAFPRIKIYIVAGLIVYGASTELLQGALTLTRLSSINDWLADVVGVCIGLVFFVILQKKRYVARI